MTKIGVDGSRVFVLEEDMDIYLSFELKSALVKLLDDGIEDVTLDLSGVESVSTPCIQVVEAARRSFKNVNVANAGPAVLAALCSFGAAR